MMTVDIGPNLVTAIAMLSVVAITWALACVHLRRPLITINTGGWTNTGDRVESSPKRLDGIAGSGQNGD